MPLLGFTVFKEKILDGSKTQTIRKLRKFPVKKGDKLYLYWHLRRSDCKRLMETFCTEETFIIIGANKVIIDVSKERYGYQYTDSDKEALAKRDGFDNVDAFFDFFISHNKMPEFFQVIRWQPLVTSYDKSGAEK